MDHTLKEESNLDQLELHIDHGAERKGGPLMMNGWRQKSVDNTLQHFEYNKLLWSEISTKK